MEQNKTIEILKQAILFEKRGFVFYTNAAQNSKDPEVKGIFLIMADEEEKHIKYLVQQFRSYESEGKFTPPDPSDSGVYSITDQVITRDLTDKISAVSFEATAIALAIDMENRAIAAYSERAKNADNQEERVFYQWLADWESGHHKILYQLDQELKEKIWSDHNFWAF